MKIISFPTIQLWSLVISIGKQILSEIQDNIFLVLRPKKSDLVDSVKMFLACSREPLETWVREFENLGTWLVVGSVVALGATGRKKQLSWVSLFSVPSSLSLSMSYNKSQPVAE